jgi:uncharacterized protein (TIGR02678 family)
MNPDGMPKLKPATKRGTAEPRGAGLAARLDEGTRQERRRALRALLRRPLLCASGERSHEFGLVRRHAPWLREWLAKYTGWGLQVDSETARLRKTPAVLADGSRPARDPKSGTPFSRRRYAILCLALAALERSDRQTTLTRLADDILVLAAGDPALARAGLVFDLSSRDQRRDLVQAIRLLLDLRVLVRVEGDEAQYISDRGDVLYNIQRPALAATLCVKRGPSTVEHAALGDRIRSIAEEALPETEQARNRRLRTHLVRRLLDDPVVYYDDLSPDELAYLRSQRSFLTGEIHEATGLVAEVRAEGIAMVDPRGDLSDLALPEEGTEGHLTLLLAEHLAEHARREPGAPLSRTALEAHTAALIARHAKHWRRSVREPGAETLLTQQTLERLLGLGLLREAPDGVVPLAAVGRYALVQPTAESEEGEPRTLSLFPESQAARPGREVRQ